MPKTKKNENYRDSEYWEKRIANETWKTYNSLEEKNIDLLQMYEVASKQIKSELLELAEKAEINGSLSRTDQYRFQKLLGEQGHIYKECERLGEQIEAQSKERMINGGKAVYGNVMESLNTNDYSMPNKKVMEQMLRKPWQGSNFSKRLWKNMAKLESTLNTVIVSGITTGKTVTEMAVQLSNEMNHSFNEAHRLVRTETVNYLNQSAKLAYKDVGVKQVQWWAAKDERTCPTCGANHGKTYPIDKAPNLPCHPGCRCTWLPVIDEEIQKFKGDISSEQEVIRYCNDVLQIPKVNLKNVDDRATDIILTTLANMYSTYPELNQSIEEICQIESATMAVGLGSSYSKFILAVNPKFFSYSDYAAKMLNKQIRQGLFDAETTIATMPYHEIGHMFEGLYIDKNYNDSEKEKAWDNCTAATSILKQASLKCYNEENKYSTTLRAISGYAAQLDSEGLAECVRLELSGKGNEFTHTVFALLRGEKNEK